MEMRIISAVSMSCPTPRSSKPSPDHGGSRSPAFDDADRIRRENPLHADREEIAAVYHAIGMDPTDRPLADFIVPLTPSAIR
jgi:aminobenzoyl-glutamate utilization protein B